MSIDWEELLGAEGDEMQDAYDRAVEDWDRLTEPAPARRRRPKRRRGGYYDDPLYYEGMGSEAPKKKGPPPKREPGPFRILPDYIFRQRLLEPTPFLEAIRRKLEAACQLEFHWIRSGQGALLGLADSEDRLVKIDHRLSGFIVTYPFSHDAKMGGDRQTLAVQYQDREPRWEYDAARLPLRLIAVDGETLWDRASNSGGLVWQWLAVSLPDGAAEFEPMFLHQDGGLIWEDAPLYARFAQKEQERLASIRERQIRGPR